MCQKPPNIMWSRKYVVPEICRPGDNMSAICRPETGENMSAQKKFLGGAAPEPPRAQRRRSDTTTRAKNITHTQQQTSHRPIVYKSIMDPKKHMDMFLSIRDIHL
jgi:hypothetical protein